MTDYTRQPAARPWSKSLDLGDILTESQARCIDATRLADFGLQLLWSEDLLLGEFATVRPIKEA